MLVSEVLRGVAEKRLEKEEGKEEGKEVRIEKIEDKIYFAQD